MSSSDLTSFATAAENDAALLAEDVELEPELKVRILELTRGLDRMDHYALLGVDRAADRKTVKRAYYELAAAFHPDRYFRKRLGSFKVLMEAIFSRLTLAHEILGDKERRAEYDNYLREVSRSRGIEELIADALAEVKRAEEAAVSEVGPPSPAPATAAASAPAAPAQSSASAPAAPRAPTPVVDDAARREALARRLLGGRTPSSMTARAAAATGGQATTGQATAPRQPQSAAEAVEALRRRYEDRIAQSKSQQARKYAQNAEAARAAGDPVAAANALRVAATLAPSDADLQRRAVEAQSEADALLGETYTKQAQYEEKNGQWTEAARSWTRACRGRPNDAHAHERAANAILQASGDLHQAAKLAKRACEIEPASVVARTTLASAYLGAGMVLSAKRELETAAQLAPHDGTIRSLMEKMAKAT
jgi:curved DNA-binding protein CbpA